MNGIVLGTNRSKITAKKLADCLNVEYTETTPHDGVHYDYAFRYGNSHAPLENNTPHFVFNPMVSIERSIRKPEVRRLLLANEIPAPRIIDRDNLNNARYPLIARPVNHYKGKSFYMLNTTDEADKYLRRGYYLQELIKKDKEFRVFVFKDKIFEVNIKKQLNEEANETIRNYRSGWGFSWMTYKEIPRQLRNICRLSAEIIGLDFCGIDCCLDENGKPFIFEVNSAPGLIPRKVEKLATKIKEWLGEHGLR